MSFELNENLTFNSDPKTGAALVDINDRLRELSKGKRGMANNPDYVKDALNLVEQYSSVVKEPEIQIVSAKTKEGRKIEFNLKERLEHYRDFYQKTGVDWVNLPDTITITKEQQKEMERLITELGFDHMIIIPEGLVGETEVIKDASGKITGTKNERYAKLHKLMSSGYSGTQRSPDYKNYGDFEGSVDTSIGFRIILTKDLQELEEDELCKSTVGKSLDDLKLPGGIFKKYSVYGLSESEYLVYQREYYRRTGKHLDCNGWTWLPGSVRPFFGLRIPRVGWAPFDSNRLSFVSEASGSNFWRLGCRLACSFDVRMD